VINFVWQVLELVGLGFSDVSGVFIVVKADIVALCDVDETTRAKLA